MERPFGTRNENNSRKNRGLSHIIYAEKEQQVFCGDIVYQRWYKSGVDYL